MPIFFLSCGEDFFGKYSPAECQQIIFEPPNGVLSFYNDKSAPHLLAVDSPCAPAATGAAAPTTLFVSDRTYHRILSYDITTITDGENAANVLGRTDFTSVGIPNPSQSTVRNPEHMVVDSTNNRLFAVDRFFNRVLIFDVSSITDGENAVNVLGQTDFETTGSGTTQSTLSSPWASAYDSTNNRLFISDRGNNRVLVFDVSSITDGENAVNVLGQPDFVTADAATTQSGMSDPRGLAYDATNNRLFVGERTNHRVLVFNVSSITDGENAVNVLGQPDFVTAEAATTQSGLSFPEGLAYDATNNRLFVADRNNARVLVFDVSSITNGENAVNVLGEPDFVTADGGVTQSALVAPTGVAYDSVNQLLYATDNARVMVFNVSSITNGENAVNVLCQSDFTSNAAAATQSGCSGPDGLALK